ncbi:light-harvesting complex-like protein 3 isotype 1, chloroplastic [Diospyros lotus]|uniref:light-harvesting complex-like protein 3 isotype 1, chloroplastic n=1 Tax=Diospyros lotus TaxID=55363 RepID=UPI002254FC18|nr:light-harvesting complex-like protein 3 isotype 1, chloroplastic [Diospyros lotus]
MASIAITASMPRACSSYHVTKKQQSLTRPTPSLVMKQSTQFVTLDAEGQKCLDTAQQEKSDLPVDKPEGDKDEASQSMGAEKSTPKFMDDRWKNGTWDLNMFVKNGKMDWDGVIVAEARRRKFIELHPEVASNQEPVLFRSTIIPWWAWIMHSHLPEAELLNGRAAMVGFFMAYFVDILTGLDLVGQTGNAICKAGLFITVIGIVLFRRKDDLERLQKLANEATLYDKQWQSSWRDQQDVGSCPNNNSEQN